MSKHEKKGINEFHGDAVIAPPFPLPDGEFDFGAPILSPPHPLGAERADGSIALLAHCSRTKTDAVPAVLFAAMRVGTPDEFRYLIVDYTDGLSVFDGTDYAVSNAVSGAYAELVLSAVDCEAERRERERTHCPNILLTIAGADAECIDGLITADRMARYSRVGIYVLIAPSCGSPTVECEYIDASELSEYSASALRKTVAAFDRRNV